MSAKPEGLQDKRSGSWWALLGILVLVAHASLFGVGPIGEDFRTLVEASRSVHADLRGADEVAGEHSSDAAGLSATQAELSSNYAGFYNQAGTAGRPLAALSLGVSSWIWTSKGVWTPAAISWLRLENLILLALVSFGMARFLRRLVAPWTGSEHANAASSAAFMILMVHPLSVAAVASPAARGDLLAGVLAMVAGAAFLRGRQERNYLFVVLAALCTFASTLASELGFLCPIWLAVIEYASSRRYRPKHVRLRTALTTFVVFSVFAGLDIALRIWVDVDPWPMELHASLLTLTSFGDAMMACFSGLTKLGVLILPVNGANAGGFGFVFGALLLVVVVQPALHAGLSAPRFWITMLCVWLMLVLLAEATRATLDVGPNDFSDSAGLFPAVVVMAIGISLAATSVSGGRRQAIPLIVAFILCTLARSNARGWRYAAKHARSFQVQASELIQRAGVDQNYLVVDAPGLIDLFRATPSDFGWMFDQAMTGKPGRAEDFKIRSLSSPAMLAYSRLAEFDEARADGLVILFRNDLVQATGRTRWVSEGLSLADASNSVIEWRNPVDVDGVSKGGHWSSASGQTPFFANSADIECITVSSSAMVNHPHLVASELHWRSRGGVVHGGMLEGVWLQDAAGDHVVFDPGSSLPWLFGPRVDVLLLMGDLAESSGAEVWSSPPTIPDLSEPAIDDDDWHFGTPAAARFARAGDAKPTTEEDVDLPEPADVPRPPPEESWVLVLLDLETFEYAEILCKFDGDKSLYAPDAEDISRGLRSVPGSLAWGVEHRIDGIVIERSGGRL